MNPLFTFLTIVIFVLLSLFVSHANALEVGDEAPEIAIEKWINGGSVKIKEGAGEKIFVVADAMLTNNALKFRDIEIALKAAESSNQTDENTQILK